MSEGHVRDKCGEERGAGRDLRVLCHVSQDFDLDQNNFIFQEIFTDMGKDR